MVRRSTPVRSSALLAAAVLAAFLFPAGLRAQETKHHSVGIVVHGGAGTILRGSMTPDVEKAVREKITEALMKGYAILKNDGSSLDAVEAVIRILEDSPLFNAGKGAVFTHEGTNELDAAIMDGSTLKAGAVAGVKHIRNPISLARMVMERSPHVMMAGEGAEAFARSQGVELVPQDYFYTEKRWKQLQDALSRDKAREDSLKARQKAHRDTAAGEHGTVGCVALDHNGNLAAGTSTGGMTDKRYGRIGDSPVIGAGTYANNSTCAVSGTGTGEYFIRLAVAHDISSLMEYRGMSLEQAARTVVMDKLTKLGGEGGVIAIDRDGHTAMPFNSSGMYRAYIDSTGNPVVKIYKD